MPTTEDRIESLENQLRSQQDQVLIQQSQVRRQRRWNIALGAVIVGGGLMAATGVQSVPDVIQARKFEVVNDEGAVVVESGSIGGGGFTRTLDESGNPMFFVVAEKFEDGTHFGQVSILNSSQHRLVSLGVDSGGKGRVSIQNGDGFNLVTLGASKSGNGIVTTENGKGVSLVRITANRSGDGAVLAQDASGNIKATLP